MATQSATVTPVGDRQIVIERDFDAPARLIWEAWHTPEHVRRWWTAKRGTDMVCEIDFRVGGRWRYAMQVEDFGEVAFHGEYLEIEPYTRVVSTEAYEGIPNPDENASTNTLTLTEADGRTHLHILIEHVTPEGRDGHLASGMESGLQDALDLLEEVAISLR